ncbi:MAG: hypothetical protein KKD99_05540 [Proteobacteria bacterium]|nr:hypothetical protein [Pseudomonadota bacterium]
MEAEMIARLSILLPFSLNIPQEETFQIYSYIDEGYEIRFYPLAKSGIYELPDSLKEVKIDETTILCPDVPHDVLHIDFYKDNFDRRKNGDCDPPYDFIRRTFNSFLSKLRFVTRGGQIKPIDYPYLTWDISYLNDDGTELQKEEGLVRGRSNITKTISLISLNRQMWEEIHQLPYDYAPPEWDGLLLDAYTLLPEVGPAIVLAMTALEVFISQILDALVENSTIPNELWKWINKREWRPNVEDRFDILLYVLTGVSLKKENPVLWQAFKHLQQARNNFVHKGVTKADAPSLLKAAADIIGFVRELLPDEMRWPQFHHKIECKVLLKIL